MKTGLFNVAFLQGDGWLAGSELADQGTAKHWDIGLKVKCEVVIDCKLRISCQDVNAVKP